MRPLSPTSAPRLRREVDRVLAQLGLAEDPYAPRELAVVLALRDQVPVPTVLARLGVDVAALRPPPGPAAGTFAALAPGAQFSHDGRLWTKATFDQALGATPDRHRQRLVVNAYATAAGRRGPVNAFAWDPSPDHPQAACLVAGVAADARVAAAPDA